MAVDLFAPPSKEEMDLFAPPSPDELGGGITKPSAALNRRQFIPDIKSPERVPQRPMMETMGDIATSAYGPLTFGLGNTVRRGLSAFTGSEPPTEEEQMAVSGRMPSDVQDLSKAVGGAFNPPNAILTALLGGGAGAVAPALSELPLIPRILGTSALVYGTSKGAGAGSYGMSKAEDLPEEEALANAKEVERMNMLMGGGAELGSLAAQGISNLPTRFAKGLAKNPELSRLSRNRENVMSAQAAIEEGKMPDIRQFPVKKILGESDVDSIVGEINRRETGLTSRKEKITKIQKGMVDRAKLLGESNLEDISKNYEKAKDVEVAAFGEAVESAKSTAKEKISQIELAGEGEKKLAKNKVVREFNPKVKAEIQDPAFELKHAIGRDYSKAANDLLASGGDRVMVDTGPVVREIDAKLSSPVGIRDPSVLKELRGIKSRISGSKDSQIQEIENFVGKKTSTPQAAEVLRKQLHEKLGIGTGESKISLNNYIKIMGSIDHNESLRPKPSYMRSFRSTMSENLYNQPEAGEVLNKYNSLRKKYGAAITDIENATDLLRSDATESYASLDAFTQGKRDKMDFVRDQVKKNLPELDAELGTKHAQDFEKLMSKGEELASQRNAALLAPEEAATSKVKAVESQEKAQVLAAEKAKASNLSKLEMEKEARIASESGRSKKSIEMIKEKGNRAFRRAIGNASKKFGDFPKTEDEFYQAILDESKDDWRRRGMYEAADKWPELKNVMTKADDIRQAAQYTDSIMGAVGRTISSGLSFGPTFMAKQAVKQSMNPTTRAALILKFPGLSEVVKNADKIKLQNNKEFIKMWGGLFTYGIPIETSLSRILSDKEKRKQFQNKIKREE